MPTIEKRAYHGRRAAAAFAVVALGLAAAGCSKSDANDYVVTPADLKRDFTSKHPGPDWVLARDDQFHLTAEQKTKLASLGDKLSADLTGAGETVRKAYQTFRSDAQDPESDRDKLLGDVEKLASAQAMMTKIVVVAHYEVFADLDPGQQKNYRDLVACCGPPP